MASSRLEIVCSACGADTLLVREPLYEGFKKAGETLRCSACGHEFAGESDVPFKARKQASVFTQSDASAKVTVFNTDETGSICRHCKHYLVNPFTQRCGIRLRSVEATDTCDRFEARPPEAAKPDPSQAPRNPLLDG